MGTKAKDIILAVTVMMFVALFVLAIMGIIGAAPATVAAIEPYVLVVFAITVLAFFLSIS